MVVGEHFRWPMSLVTQREGHNASSLAAIPSLSLPLPSFLVFHSLSLSLCLRNVPARVKVYLINAFAIKKFKIPYHVSIVKNESKSFVEISFS